MNTKKTLAVFAIAFLAGAAWSIYSYNTSPATVEKTFTLWQIPENAQFNPVIPIEKKDEKINQYESFRFLKDVTFSINKSLHSGYFIVLAGNDEKNNKYYFNESYILTSIGRDYKEYQLSDPVKTSGNGWQENVIYRKSKISLVWRAVSDGFMAIMLLWVVIGLVQVCKKEFN